MNADFIDKSRTQSDELSLKLNKIEILADFTELSSAFVNKICICSYITALNLTFVNIICICSYALN